MMVKNIRDVSTLYRGNKPVESVTVNEALIEFPDFIRQVQTPNQHY